MKYLTVKTSLIGLIMSITLSGCYSGIPLTSRNIDTDWITASVTVPEPAPSVAGIRERNIIEFGNYNWRVLDVQDSYALIITENIIESRLYHNTVEVVTWETSDIRAYLNGEFLNSFSEECRARIRETNVVNNNNPWFGTDGGNDTIDRIFLLSLEEVVRYFGDSGQLQNRPHRNPWWIDDRYNSARAARDTSGLASWWWLRTPGDLDNATRIASRGRVAVGSYAVRADWNGLGGVRPALWLRLEF